MAYLRLPPYVFQSFAEDRENQVEEEGASRSLVEARCPSCNKLMGRDVVEAKFDCTRCKATFRVAEGRVIKEEPS